MDVKVFELEFGFVKYVVGFWGYFECVDDLVDVDDNGVLVK